MNFKKETNLDNLLNEYPYIVSSSITLDGINYRVSPVSLYRSVNDIVFTFVANENEDKLNSFIESKLSGYTTMDDDTLYKYQVILTKDFILESFNNVACFKEKGMFKIIQLSNKDLTVNMVLSSKQTFLSNLTLKDSFKGKLAKETIMYLMNKNLLGNLARLHAESKYSIVDTVISPADGMCVVDNLTDDFTLAYLFTQLMIPKEYLEDMAVKVSYLNLEKSLAYLVEFKAKDSNYSFAYLPM